MALSDDMTKLLPTDPICTLTIDRAREVLHPAIFNHSLRVYFHAINILMHEGDQRVFSPAKFFPARPVDRTLLLVAALFHDAGTSSIYNGQQRFEVEGADAACTHLHTHGYDSETDLQQVWSAIALHTSTGIADRIDPFTRVLRLAVKMDFSTTYQEKFGATEYATAIEKTLPRMEIEKVLADAVVSQAGKILESKVSVDASTWPDSEKHPKASWPGILLRAHLEDPDYEGVNPAF